MDYEKMWKLLKRKLLDNQENFMRDSLGEDRKVIRNPYNFASRLINRILKLMEEIEEKED